MTLVIPHGGELIDRINLNFNISTITHEIEIDTMALSDLELIANGAYSPLTGFLSKEDYESVLSRLRFKNEVVWSILITLAVTEEVADTLIIGRKVKLTYNNIVYGVLELKEKYVPNKVEEAKKVFQTTDSQHPSVKKLFSRPEVIKILIDGLFKT
ncbi:hypothetical protein ACQCWD_27985 [Bacillus thuringiensis]|uniref:ATP-sulfurylase PUA-like domain-containing protein n=1 Tax=Bacillus cereus TaxID=1396 RepID=A0AAN6B708_BACCE|nr:hypothetical protein [Bacillus cereus]KAB2449482.1 hypothetical protein F8165_15385 [Bacillus cereus]KAB2485557.1 hypothetical protein F8157_16230 [Bacillus cereus]